MRAVARGALFDLDDTLFDHAHATDGALAQLRREEPAFLVWTVEELAGRHGAILEETHIEVLAGRLSIPEARETRFRRLLAQAGEAGGRYSERGSRARELAVAYRGFYEQSWRAVPGAEEVLAALAADGVAIAIVTNNLRSEQELKLDRCGLDRWVDALVTSEDQGVAKPDAAIFAAALRAIGVEAPGAVMVGDAWETDIVGARAAGIRPVWFNRRGRTAPEPGVSEVTSFHPLERAVEVIGGRAW